VHLVVLRVVVVRQRFPSRLRRSLGRRLLARLVVPRQERRRFRCPGSLLLLLVVPLQEGVERLLRSLVRSRRRVRRAGCRSLRLRVVVRFLLSRLRRVGFLVISGDERE
jgi:hypothetical protein